MATLRDIIKRENLDPRVIRGNGEDTGDNWETFFCHGELDEEATPIVQSPDCDRWQALSGIVLEDNLYQSSLAVSLEALLAHAEYDVG
jgi:hypothetical protein